MQDAVKPNRWFSEATEDYFLPPSPMNLRKQLLNNLANWGLTVQSQIEVSDSPPIMSEAEITVVRTSIGDV